MRFSYLLILLLFSLSLKAQNQEDTFVKDLIESLAENLPEDYDLSELAERLVFYKKHPINLNKTDAETLKELAFLSPLQINSLLSHLKNNGKLIDVLELQGVPSFDLVTIQKLLPFVTLQSTVATDKVSISNLFNLGENDLVLRFGRTLEQQKGFTALSGSRYLGEPERYLWRYKYNYSNKIAAALILEKDAGEKLFTSTKPIPFDYQSAHLAVYNSGSFKKIVLGDYLLQFGQGLVLWSGFSFGKAPDVASIAKKDVGLRAYSSSNEYSFFRGLATTVAINKNIDFTPFVSFRKLDASLSEINELTTLNETGLHRTQNEITHQNNTNQQVFGAVVQYQLQQLNIGAIAYHTKFNHQFITGDQVYRLYNFVGNQLSNFGLNYNYTFRNIYLFGEIGKSTNGGLAYVNGVLISLSSNISAAILHRHYAKDYHNFFNQATAEASQAANEKGFYVGLNFTPYQAWTLSFYADYFKFPWLKFRIDAPSDGYETLGQLTYTPNKTLKAFLRYKYEVKQQNTSLAVPINYLEAVHKSAYRGDISWKLSQSIALQNRIEVSQFKKGSANTEFGYLIYQDVAYEPMFAKFSGNIRLAYFNTASYDSRLYAYEDDVLYNFSFGMYSGKGFRTYVNLKYKLGKRLTLWTRYAMFFYPKLATVGSGLDEINGNRKTDVKLQIRYQF